MPDQQANRISALPEAFDRVLADELARGVSRGRATVLAFARLCALPLADWQPLFEDDGSVQVELNPYPELASVQCTWLLPHYDEHGEWKATSNVNLVMGVDPRQARFNEDELIMFGGDSGRAVDEMPAWLETRVDLESNPPIKVDVFVDGGLVDDE